MANNIYAYLEIITKSSEALILLFNNEDLRAKRSLVSINQAKLRKSQLFIIKLHIEMMSAITPSNILQNYEMYFVENIFAEIIGLIQIIEFSDCQQKNNSGRMITFIRHAQSLHNLKVEEHLTANNLSWDWAQLSKDQHFLNEIKYSPNLLDATITETGKQECGKAKASLEKLQPDLILVSPLNRALATCSQLFGTELTCPVIAEPILSEGLRSACDFGCEIEKKKQLYPHINFQRVESAGKYWFIDNDRDNQTQYYSIIEKNNEKGYNEILQSVFEHMKETFIFQTPTNIRRRTEKLKEALKQYGKSYTNIAIVSHYNIIRFSLAKEFNERDQPYHCSIENCEITQIQLNHL